MKLPLSSRYRKLSSSSSLSSSLSLSLIFLLLASCTSTLPEDQVPETPLRQVNVNLTGFDVTTNPIKGVTSEIPESLNRLTVSVFSAQGDEIATISQKRESLKQGETFGSLTLQVPVGTHKFVAVLHEVPSDKLTLEPATITSPTEATLPSSRIYDTYCCVQEATISATGSNSVTLALGTRINAQFRLQTLDAFPSDIKSIDVIINPDADAVPSNPTFNPTRGLATASWKYEVNLSSTSGQVFDRSFSVLLNEDPQTTSVDLYPVNTSNEVATQYQRTLENVKFQRNHVTHAKGYLFKQDVATSFTLDTSLADEITYSIQ